MKNRIILLLTLCLLFTACGTTYITANDPRIKITVRDQPRGKGAVTITRVGPPQKVEIKAYYLDTEVGNTILSRKFDFFTLLVSAYSYGAGLLFSWRYPAMVTIPIDYHLMETLSGTVSVWDRPGELGSRWNQPPPGNW